MGRRIRRRWVKPPPNNFYFIDERPSLDDFILLTVAEFEAMRLKHYIKLDQKESAEKMGISQPTFSRILENAHYKNILALIEGKQIKIYSEELNYKKPFIGYGCIDCKYEWFDENAVKKNNIKCIRCKSNNVYYLEKHL